MIINLIVYIKLFYCKQIFIRPLNFLNTTILYIKIQSYTKIFRHGFFILYNVNLYGNNIDIQYVEMDLFPYHSDCKSAAISKFKKKYMFRFLSSNKKKYFYN